MAGFDHGEFVSFAHSTMVTGPFVDERHNLAIANTRGDPCESPLSPFYFDRVVRLLCQN